jgi:Rps23 Pro-64 3,4-dihydroxylase Tpa1-like proline 4-hydroxylase
MRKNIITIYNKNMENSDAEKKIKIDPIYLEKINNNENVTQYFGNWINRINEMKTQFLSGSPFENVVIDNFLEESYAEKLYQLFPSGFEKWYHYENPIEVKYAFDNINELPEELKNYFYYLSSPQLQKIISQVTNIEDLEYDEYLHGAGLHSHPRYGRLNIHLDYEKHPYSGKERRINIIYFLTKNWDESWNGCNELWDHEAKECVKRTQVKFNRAIIFKTNDISWHGLPEKIMCPENIFRKSLAYYYVSPLNTKKEESDYRKKAKFVKRPEDPHDKNMEELYEIRRHRRITIKDMDKLFPGWKKEK